MNSLTASTSQLVFEDEHVWVAKAITYSAMLLADEEKRYSLDRVLFPFRLEPMTCLDSDIFKNAFEQN